MIEISETQLLDLIRCNQCSDSLYENAMVMNCGQVICNNCVKMSQDRIQCSHCTKEHVKKNFYPNNSVNSLLQIYKQSMASKLNTGESRGDNCKNSTAIRETQEKIEKEYGIVSEMVKSNADKLIGEINTLKSQLLNEIEQSKKEYLKNLDITFYQNTETNQIKKAENLISFEPANPIHNISMIGKLNYGSYKIDVFSKILSINELGSDPIRADLSKLLKYDDLNIHKTKLGILEKNKIFLIHERYLGNVNITSIKIIYLDGTVLYSHQINGIPSFHSYCVYDKFIVIAFRTKSRLYYISLLNDKLQVLNTYSFQMELEEIHMNSKEINLIAKESKDIVYSYDYNLNHCNSFGQNKRSKKPFYIDGDVLAIENDKIYLKKGSSISTLSRLNGLILSQLKLDFEFIQFSLDTNHDRYIVFRNNNDLILMNDKGAVLCENKLTTLDKDETYDSFQFTKSGHFCFINKKSHRILII